MLAHSTSLSVVSLCLSQAGCIFLNTSAQQNVLKRTKGDFIESIILSVKHFIFILLNMIVIIFNFLKFSR